MASPPTPFVIVPDPQLQLYKDCAECGSPMQFFRVHQGTGKHGLADRGRIVQSCSTYPRCYWTPKHTPAYLYEDAEQLVQRLWVRHSNPDDTVYAAQLTQEGAVLRLAPTTVAASSPTSIPSASQDIPSSQSRPTSFQTPCSNVECLYQNGTRTRGSKTCIETMCTSCCEASGLAARTSGTFRGKCKSHNVEGFTPPLVRPPPIQPSPAVPSVPSPSSLAPNTSSISAPQTLASVLPPQEDSDLGNVAFAAAIQSLPLTQLEQFLQCVLNEIDRKRGAGLASPQAGPSSKQTPSQPTPTTSTTSTHPTSTPQPLPLASTAIPPPSQPRASLRAQPLTTLWRQNRNMASTAALEAKDAKVLVQKRKIDEAKSVTLLIWHKDGDEPLIMSKIAKTHPRLRLDDFEDLMQALGLSEDSIVQFWDVVDALWKTGKPSTVMAVDSISRVLVRLPPTLLYKWQNCLGLDAELERLRRQKKRRGHALPDMPPAKVARTGSPMAISSQPSPISAPPPTPPQSSRTLPLRSLRNLPKSEPVSDSMDLAGKTVRGWPRDFNVAEVARGLKQMQRLLGAGDLSYSPRLAPVASNTQKKGKVTKDHAFQEVFGCRRARSTWRRIWLFWQDVSEDLKEEFIAFGDTDARGRWPVFVKAYKDMSEATLSKGKFPALSPLLSPSPPPSQVLSNVRANLKDSEMAGDDAMSELDLDITSSPRCDFCDEILDFEPTTTMHEMRGSLEAVTWPDPSPENPQHRAASSWRVTEPYCERHEFERTLLPLARRSGWPEVLDLDALCDRVLDLQDDLADLIDSPHGNEHFKQATKLLHSQSGLSRVEARKQVMLAAKTGYYGEQGHEIIHFILLRLFRGVDIAHLCPMPFETLVGSVLLPEVSTRLIMEDRTCSQAEAAKIVADSSAYGARMFPSDDEHPGLAAALQRAHSLLNDALSMSPVIKEEPSDFQPALAFADTVEYNVIREDGKEVIVIE